MLPLESTKQMSIGELGECAELLVLTILTCTSFDVVIFSALCCCSLCLMLFVFDWTEDVVGIKDEDTGLLASGEG